jgi:drug/metabolite transporter (DMT)-like permease
MQQAPWRGPAAMTAAMALFSVNDALVKGFGAELPVAQSIAIRGGVATLATLAVILAMRQTRMLRLAFEPLVVVRSLAECAAIFCLIAALTRLPIGDVTAISQIVPLILLPLAALIFGERIGLAHGLLVALGFVGVILIAKPGRAGFDPLIGLALLTALGFVARDLLARGIRADMPALAVTFSTVFVVALGGALVALIRGVAPVNGPQFLALAAAGLLLSLGQALVYLAFRAAPVSQVAAFNYSKTLFSVTIGIFVFAERPDLLTFAGMMLVVASGVGAALASARRR